MKNQKGVSLITLIITIIVVIILAVIILRSGASDAPDQAAFSGFTKEMGELQDAVSVAMLTAKGNESIKGNQRTEAQLYNFVARGGYEVLSGDSGDSMWLTQADAKNIPCTIINKAEAEDSIGMELPERKVETTFGTNQEVSYFVTPKGNVFCWPPYVYDGKSYVTADLTVKSGDTELEKVQATTKGSTLTITFDNGEIVKVSNAVGTDSEEHEFARNNGTTASGEVAVWYGTDVRTAPADRGVAAGYTFSTYYNNK